MRLRHIEVFHAVMQAGTVSGAAHLLHISQPAVTKVLQHAEAQLGFALFERVRGKFHPTPEALRLYVVRAAGTAPPVDADNIAAHCRAALPAYKVPRQIVFVEALPKSSVGKILRRELRDMA